MKREITCKTAKCLHDRVTTQDRRIYGFALFDMRCDWCNAIIKKGDVVAASTIFGETPSETLADEMYNWERRYIVVAQ